MLARNIACKNWENIHHHFDHITHTRPGERAPTPATKPRQLSKRSAVFPIMAALELDVDCLFSGDDTISPLDDLLLDLATSPAVTDGSLLSFTEPTLLLPDRLGTTATVAGEYRDYGHGVPWCGPQPSLAPKERQEPPASTPCATLTSAVRCESHILTPACTC